MPLKYTIKDDSAYFDCPGCGAPLETKIKNANFQDACPRCHQSFISPGSDASAISVDLQGRGDSLHCRRCQCFKIFGGLCDKCKRIVVYDLTKIVLDGSSAANEVNVFLGKFGIVDNKAVEFRGKAYSLLVENLFAQISNPEDEANYIDSASKYAKCLFINSAEQEQTRARISSRCQRDRGHIKPTNHFSGLKKIVDHLLEKNRRLHSLPQCLLSFQRIDIPKQ